MTYELIIKNLKLNFGTIKEPIEVNNYLFLQSKYGDPFTSPKEITNDFEQCKFINKMKTNVLHIIESKRKLSY